MNVDAPDRKAILEELERLRNRMAELENQLAGLPQTPWRATRYYTSYYATAGFFLGMFASFASLLLNVIGSALVGKHPLQLIQIYLTFPLGEKALELDSGVALAVGCVLYVGTGMLLGIPFHLVLTRFAAGRSLVGRLLLASEVAVVLWIINFYGILIWLQPLLFGDSWILDLVPWYVAALTHLVFGWTMAILYPLGLYEPYQPPSEAS